MREAPHNALPADQETSVPPGGPRSRGRLRGVNSWQTDRPARPGGRWNRRFYVTAVLCAAALVGTVLGVKPIAGASAAYQEKYRPQVHFSPAENWMNDPNGMIYYKGQYHLFFQYNPSGITQDNLSWGHAVSSDLLHWKQLPVAIEQTADEMVFSGSVVFDESNSSGLGTAEKPPLVAIFTSFFKESKKQEQSLAFSVDDGATWTRYKGNPVLDTGSTSFRDPKVFWHEPTKSWLAPIALSDQNKIAFYSSPDLKTWKHLSDFGPAGATGEYECPDLFPLSVDGDSGKTKWVMVVNINPGGLQGGSGTQYFVGDFDGTKFTADSTDTRWVDYGSDFYAGVTFDDAPQRIMIAWMSNWLYGKQTPTTPWRGADSFPRELSLKTIGGAPQLVSEPIEGLSALHSGDAVASMKDTTVKDQTTALEGGGAELEIDTVLKQTDAKRFGVNVRTGKDQFTQIGYDTSTNELYIDRTKSGDVSFDPKFPGVHRAPLALDNGQLKLRIIVDASSVEVFADQGQVTLTDQIFPDPDSAGLSVFAEGGSAQVSSLDAWKLGSIWQG